jgi:DNA-nicking Smr family endonuclease
MAGATLIPVRGHDDNIRKIGYGYSQGCQTIGLVAVVIAKQYSQTRIRTSMMKKPRDKHSNSEETTLFRDAVGEVRPVANRRRRLAPPAPKPDARFTEADRRAVLDEAISAGADSAEIETGDELVFQRPGVSRKAMRQLRRGKYALQAETDLHGMTVDQARAELHAFIRDCHARRLTCVRVVHGKGLGSGPRGPVLKSGVNRWLSRWQEVAAFCSARPADGGTGAVYVLLTR